jgi:hypothetical protein
MSDAPDTQQVAIVQDHAFEPRTESKLLAPEEFRTARMIAPWDGRQRLPANPWLCQHCDLAEAAHIR